MWVIVGIVWMGQFSWQELTEFGNHHGLESLEVVYLSSILTTVRSNTWESWLERPLSLTVHFHSPLSSTLMLKKVIVVKKHLLFFDLILSLGGMEVVISGAEREACAEKAVVSIHLVCLLGLKRVMALHFTKVLILIWVMIVHYIRPAQIFLVKMLKPHGIWAKRWVQCNLECHGA